MRFVLPSAYSQTGLRTRDILLLNELLNNGGYLTVNSSTRRVVVDTVSV